MPTQFQLLASHPALDFVNTLDERYSARGPIEKLSEYGDLLEFMKQTALLGASQIRVLAARSQSAGAAKALRQARELREALADLVYGTLGEQRKPSPTTLKILQRHFFAANAHQELTSHRAGVGAEPAQMVWEWGRFETDVSLPVWVIAQAISKLLTSHEMAHVHICLSQTCRWLFLDTSKNHSRRWCDMKLCGNRMKARRFQAKRE